MTALRLIAAVVIAVLAIVVIAQNTETVETHLLFVTISMPRAILLISTLAIGFVLGLLAAAIIEVRLDRHRQAPEGTP
ncbi:MAG: LapA family protein [Planctomycetota bacterium]|jgi:uncharacterized integral membrane protein